MTQFEIGNGQFLLNGSPFRILSGSIHYFRVLPELWEDRLRKLKMCGFNTVETYVAWNFHETSEGVFRFDGGADLGRFLALAQSLGLWAIVRPSPYICAEWEFGGFPAWLLRDPGLRLRCANRAYLDKVDAWFDALMPRLEPLQYTRGGPVLMMQIENEYGSYGGDKAYLRHLADAMRARGIDVPLFTSDGPDDLTLVGGTLPDIYKTVNFGSKPAEAFGKLAQWQDDKPPMVMEYWNGWFDHWGETHHTRTAGDAAAVFDEMMATGASVNFYMFHGGTNFGFWNGANRQEKYEPTITSYDYDSPLDENGDATEKWYRVREVLAKHVPVDMSYEPPVSRKKAYGPVRFLEMAPLFGSLDALSSPVDSAFPEPMEMYGQHYGFILYAAQLPPVSCRHVLKLRGVHDRAMVYVNGVQVGLLERDTGIETLDVDLAGTDNRLEILVENMGRVNYGELLLDRKGILDGVKLDYQYLFGWTVRPLPLTDLSQLSFQPASGTSFAASSVSTPMPVSETASMPASVPVSSPSSMPAGTASVMESGIAKDTTAGGAGTGSGPAFHRGFIEVDEPADTFLSTEGWDKGMVWVNGFNLGRYWKRGPQKTLYVPAPLLHKGRNEVIVLELHGTGCDTMSFVDKPELG